MQLGKRPAKKNLSGTNALAYFGRAVSNEEKKFYTNGQGRQ